MKSSKYWSIVTFFTFFTLFVGVILRYVPFWGLQDDFQSLYMAKIAW